MRKMIIAGNWKMNKDLKSARELAEELVKGVNVDKVLQTVVGVPYPFLRQVAGICKEHHGIGVAAQNLYPMDEGSYTGEVSGPMITSCGAKFVIVGHSERRQYFNENNDFINKKVRYAIDAGLKPILCVGESLKIRESGEHDSFVIEQLKACIKGVEQEDAFELIVAYEPVWAIGTGKTASPEQAQEMHSIIRAFLKESLGTSGDQVPILYGGSMKPKNAESLLNCEDIDGGLIGGASLEADSFLGIRKIAESILNRQ